MSKHEWKKKQPVVGSVRLTKDIPTPTLKRPIGKPRWLLSRIDLDGCDDGQFGWRKMTASCVLDVIQKLKNFEGATWHELEARNRNQGSHFLTYEKLSDTAKARITARKVVETDCIYSMRSEGVHRIIGLRFEDDFFVVWLDPDHEFCPSQKK